MATFGEVLVAIVWEIISSTVGTALKVGSLVLQLFQIVAVNAGTASAIQIMVMVLIIAAVLFALFKLFKGDIKHLIVAFILLALMLLISALAA